MKELTAQGYLVNAAEKAGGHAFKMNNRFIKGVFDLSVKLPGRPHVYVEVKMASRLHMSNHRTERQTTVCTLTPHQWNFLRAYKKAGGIAGWVAIAPYGRGQRFYASADDKTQIHRIDLRGPGFFDRHHGDAWPIEEIVDRIQHDCMNRVHPDGSKITYSRS